jgi:hypothetical protein
MSSIEPRLQDHHNKNTKNGDKYSKLNFKRQMPLKETSFQKNYYYFSKRNEEEIQSSFGLFLSNLGILAFFFNTAD